MSTANITDVRVTAGGLAVIVTFSVNHGKKTRSYLYSSIEAVRGILNGEDPASWSGVRIEDDDAGAGAGSIGDAGDGISGDIATAITEIGEL